MRKSSALLLLFAGLPLCAEVQFNRDIRPILSDKCYACHGPDANNRKTKMRLDVEADAKQAAIVPGDPEHSKLYQRITSTNKATRMPPAYLGHEALKEREIALIRDWIKDGAPYQRHWSFIPPTRPATPEVSEPKWVRNPIDAFILSRLDREGLHHSPEADRRTLIRRVTLDLTGLPPTPSEVEAFVNDQSPNAYEKVVDRLLASTEYAERMAIRWLEAARYADTNGYQTDGPRTMWKWRDWVINAFHKDMPWTEFTIEQLAGDLLPNPTLDQLIATGFHRNNRTSAEGGSINQELLTEYAADRAETTSTVWLGLTTGCARCHDHKFDPIKQKDYYSLFAFFNNVPERGFVWNFGNEDPLIKAPSAEQQRKLAELDETLANARAALARAEKDIDKKQRKWERKGQIPADSTVSEGLVVRVNDENTFDGKNVTEKTGPKLDYEDPFTLATWVRPEKTDGAILSRGEDDFEGAQHALYILKGKLRLHVTFRWSDLALRLETKQPLKLHEWQHVAVTYDGKRKAAGVHVYVDGVEQQVDILLDQLLNPLGIKQKEWRLGAGGGLRFQGALRDTRVYTRSLTADEVAILNVKEPLGQVAHKVDRTRFEEIALRECYRETAEAQAPRLALKQAEAARQAYYEALPETMIMRESAEVRPAHVLKRGAYDAPGDLVQRAVPSALPQLPEGAPRNRLGLAQWLVDKSNPLTARVAVNRWWAMLFGIGIVKTVEDFGSQGEWPVHPELLDWLAVEFMDSGWSAKHMIRTMVLSNTYRQSSRTTPDLQQRDPENRLLARAPRFRLSPEMIRDSALEVSGLLVDKVGGPPVKPYQPAGLWQELTSSSKYNTYVEDTGDGLYRRSIYSYWRRTIPPPSMINFDSPTRETCTVRENRTNTPLQALGLMNEVTYLEAARRLAETTLHNSQQPDARVRTAFVRVLGRQPGAAEAKPLISALNKFETYYENNPKEAEAFLASTGKSRIDGTLPKPTLAATTAICSLMLNLDEAITKE